MTQSMGVKRLDFCDAVDKMACLPHYGYYSSQSFFHVKDERPRERNRHFS
jgi:hypothetical protein